MIAVVDYQKGNLKSVERGLIAAGGEAFITADASEIAKADAIVLPGVGAFADAAATMCELGQMEAIRERVRVGVPFLGICLGEHLMFEHGVEGAPEGSPACGLGLLPGTVVAMPRYDAQGKAFKVPHVGWNTIEIPACGGSAAVPPCGEGGGNAVLKQSSLRCGTARGTSPDSAALLDGGQAVHKRRPIWRMRLRRAVPPRKKLRRRRTRTRELRGNSRPRLSALHIEKGTQRHVSSPCNRYPGWPRRAPRQRGLCPGDGL